LLEWRQVHMADGTSVFAQVNSPHGWLHRQHLHADGVTPVNTAKHTMTAANPTDLVFKYLNQHLSGRCREVGFSITAQPP